MSDVSISEVVAKTHHFMLCIPTCVADMMAAAAVGAYPQECCGLLVGQLCAEPRGHDRPTMTAVRACSLDNAAVPSQRQHRYLIAPDHWLAVEREARQAGQEIVGVYHSHPTGTAQPSETDLAHARPALAYVIMASDGQRMHERRVWRLASNPRRFVEGVIGYLNESDWRTTP